jgi:hypothetical protein
MLGLTLAHWVQMITENSPTLGLVLSTLIVRGAVAKILKVIKPTNKSLT